jgi:hypothetical protein
MLHVRICAGGAGRPAFLPRQKSLPMSRTRNLECADNGGALDFLAFQHPRIQSGVALRLPPHSKSVFQMSARACAPETMKPGLPKSI